MGSSLSANILVRVEPTSPHPPVTKIDIAASSICVPSLQGGDANWRDLYHGSSISSMSKRIYDCKDSNYPEDGL
jgi:hypothetical protein